MPLAAPEVKVISQDLMMNAKTHLNQLLTEMDGFGSNTNVIVLAATNRADVLGQSTNACRAF